MRKQSIVVQSLGNKKMSKSFLLFERLIIILVLLVCTKVNGKSRTRTNETTEEKMDMKENLKFNYTGPESCEDDGNILGYSDLVYLNQDMLLDAFDVYKLNKEPLEEYRYLLCPNTVFNFNTAGKVSSIAHTIVVYFDNTIISCGLEGSIDSSCVFSGGMFHVYFAPELRTENGMWCILLCHKIN